MKEELREKVGLLIFDKVILGLIALAALWHVEDRRHQQSLEVARGNLAGQILPNVANSDWTPDDRARLLSILVDAQAIQPHAVAQFTQQLNSARSADTRTHTIDQALDVAGCDTVHSRSRSFHVGTATPPV